MKLKNILYKKYIILIFFIIVILHIYLLSRLIFFPYPELFTFPYLTDKGLLPYTQIWDNHFPGPFFLPINLRTLGLIDDVAARYWSYGIVILIHFLIFYTTKLITKNSKFALAANFLFLVWQPFLGGWALWIDSILGIFYLLAFLFSYKFIIQKKKKLFDIFLVGLFLGISFFVKQIAASVIFLVFLVLFYCNPKPKTFIFFVLGLLPINFFVLIYLGMIGVFQDFWSWTVLYHFSDAVKLAYKAPDKQELFKTFLIYSPIFFSFFLKEKRIAFLFIAFILGGFVGYVDRFDNIHLQPTLPLIIILSVTLFFVMKDKFMKSVPFTLFLIPYFLFTLYWLSSFYSIYTSQSHEVWYFTKQTFQLSNRLKQLTKPNEEVFIYGPIPLIYIYSETIPAGRVFTLIFPWNMPVVEDEYVSILENNPPRIILRDLTSVVDGKPITQFAPRLNYFIYQNYETFEILDNNEFMRRKNE